MTHHVKPGESIQAAIDRASDGDTIQLPAGIITGNFDLSNKRGITIRGVSIEKTTLKLYPRVMDEAHFNEVMEAKDPPAAATGQTSRPPK